MGLAQIISGDLGVMRIYRTVDPFVEWGLLILFSDEKQRHKTSQTSNFIIVDFSWVISESELKSYSGLSLL